MTDSFSKYISGLQTSARKKEELSQTGTQKMSDMRGAALSSIFGIPASTASQENIQNIDPSEGLSAYSNLSNYSRALEEVTRQRNTPRTNLQAIGDSLGDIGVGALNTIGGAASLLMNPLFPGGSDAMAQSLQRVTEAQQGMQSRRLQEQRKLNADLNTLTQENTEKEYQADIASGTPEWKAELKRIGKDAVNAVQNAGRAPAVFGSGASTAVGSLLGIGPLSSVLRAAGAGPVLAGAYSIGVSEGGGVLNQVLNEQREKGVPLDKRMEAARTAALIQAPVSALTGLGVARFEGNPLQDLAGLGFRQALRRVGGNTVKELLEEGAQSTTGQLSQNYGVQRHIDPTQRLTEGVGQALGEGALYGSLTPSIVQSPSLAIGAVNTTTEAINNLGTARREANRRNSPVSTENVSAEISSVVESTPEIVASTVQGMQEQNVPQEAQEEVVSFVENFQAAMGWSSEVLQNQGVDPALVDAVGETSNTLETLQGLGSVVANENLPMEQRQQAASIFHTIKNSIDGLIEAESQEINSLPEDSPIRSLLDSYKQTFRNMQSNPETNIATRQTEETITNSEIAPISDEAINTPTGQTQASVVIAQAEIAPERVNPDTAQTVLKHADEGHIQLTEQQRDSLQATIALMTAAREYDTQMQNQGMKPADVVGSEIKSADSGSRGKSVLKHYKDIHAAIKAGEYEVASDLVRRLGEFARHMQGKVHAHNRSLTSRKKETYPVYSSTNDSWSTGSEYTAQTHPNNAQSVRLAQQTANEAAFVASVHNSLLRIFTQLQGTPVAVVPFDSQTLERVRRPAQTSAQSQQVSPNTSTQSDASPGSGAEVSVSSGVDSNDTSTGEITLNEGQQRAFNQIIDFFLNKPEENQFSLIGAAGTGKTTLVNRIIATLNEAKSVYGNVILSAPTHRANAVSRSKNPDQTILTLHQLLGLKPEVNLEEFDANNVDFVSVGEDKFPVSGTIIIDESSMINDALYDEIVKRLEGTEVKILFLGDAAQLQPVEKNKSNPKDSKALTDPKNRAELTKVERAKNPELLGESVSVRETGKFTNQQNYKGNSGIRFYNSPQEFLNRAIQAFKSNSFKENPLLVRIVSATNARVNNWNNAVRTALYGQNASAFMEGELLMGYHRFGEPKESGLTTIANGVDYIVSLVGEERTVSWVGVPVQVVEITIKDIFGINPEEKVEVVSPNNTEETLRSLGQAFIELDRQAFLTKNRTEFDAEAGKFVLMNDLKGRVETPNKSWDKTLIKKTIAYGYAHTIHKSQGGTYDYVFVDDPSINSFRSENDRKRLRYVGMTRAENGAFILTNNEIKPQQKTQTTPQEASPIAEPTVSTTPVVERETSSHAPQTEVITSEPTQQETPAPVSRITPEQARKLTDDGLDRRRVNIASKYDQDRTPEDDATMEVLTAEYNRREAEKVPSLDKTDRDPGNFTYNLVSGSRFLSTFVNPEKIRSRIINLARPLRALDQAMRSNESIAAFLNQDSGRMYTEEQLDAMRGVLRSLASPMMKTMDERLQKFLDKPYSTKTKKTHKQMLSEGDAVLDLTNAQNLNIVENVNGKYQYNPNLLQAAVAAAVHWRMTNSRGTTQTDPVDIAKSLGISLADLTSDMVEQYNTTQGVPDLINSLTNTIKDFWGQSTVANPFIGLEQGIPQAIAAELMATMLSMGLITEVNPIRGSNNRVFKRYVVDAPKNPERFDGVSDILGRLVQVEYQDNFVVGSDQTIPTPTKVLRSDVDLTQEQKESIKNQNNQEYTEDTVTLRFFNALGSDGVIEWLVGKKPDYKNMNQNHAQSIEGKIRSILGGFRTLQNTHASILTVGDPSNTPVRWKHEVISNGRAHQQGAYNPQNNKLMRAVYSPNRTTIDLSDTNSDLFRGYMLALAQAADIKVHNQPHEVSIREVGHKLHKMSDSLFSIKEWIKENEGKADSEVTALPDGFLATFKEEAALAGYPANSELGMNALIDYARYELAEDKSQFNTQFYLEADGATNGPFNAMMLFMTNITPSWIKNITKGGFSFRDNMSLNGLRKLDSIDLYKELSNKITDLMGKVISSPNIDSDVRNHTKHILTLLGLFNKDVSFDPKTNTLEIDRGLTKNPLTITLYGSGANGIAGNLVEDIMSSVYERMSDVLEMKSSSDLPQSTLMFIKQSSSVEEANEKFAQFINAMQALSGTFVTNKRNEGLVVNVAKNADPLAIKNLNTFTLTKKQKENIVSNFEHLFVSSMRDSITDIVGQDVMENLSLIQKATQAQSYVLADLFHQRVQQVIAQKKAEGTWKSTNFLTRKEVQDIHNSLLPLAPIIKNPNQSFYMAHSEREQVQNVASFGKDTEEQFDIAPSLSGPANAGVRAIPLMVIGSGDAYAMQILTSRFGVENVLQIFDGVNLPIDKIFDYSKLANDAVRASHEANPMKSVWDSFNQFLKNAPMDSLSQDTIDAIGRTLNLRENSTNVRGISRGLTELSSILEGRAAQRDAVQTTLKAFTNSLDQMASAASPSVNQGITLDPSLSPEEIAQALNDHMEGKEPTTTRAMEQQGLSSFKEHFKKNPLFNLIADTLGDTIRVVTGSIEAIKAQALKDGIKGFSDTTKGLFSPSNNTLYAKEGDLEVLEHEGIHAATYANLVQFYTDGTGPIQVAVVRSAEALMNQFLALDTSMMSVEAQIAISNATAAINEGLVANTPEGKARALSEFMAWGLSNQDISKTLRATEATKLSNIATKIISMIHRFLSGSKAFTFSKDMLSRLRFNTAVIAQIEQPTLKQTLLNTLQHNTAFGVNERLDTIRERIAQRIGTYAESFKTTNPLTLAEKRIGVERAKAFGKSVTDAVSANGFPMSMNQKATFESMVTIMATDMKINPNTVIRAQELYTHVMNHLDQDMFITDPTNPDPNELARANLKIRTLSGEFTRAKDANDRTALLSIFLALGTVDDQFKEIISNLPRPKDDLAPWNSVDNVVNNIGEEAIDRLGNLLSGDFIKNKDVASSLNSLVDRLTSTAQDSESFLEQVSGKASGFIGKMDDVVADAMDRLGSKVNDVAKGIQDTASNPYIKLISGSTAFAASLLQKEVSGNIGEMSVNAVSKLEGWNSFRKLVSDMAGRTTSNGTIYDMIKTVRGVVSQTRQVYRDNIPEIIAKKFKTPLTEAQWDHMTRGIGRTDFTALMDDMLYADAVRVISDDAAILREISKLESQGAALVDSATWGLMLDKADLLSRRMVNDVNNPVLAHNVLTNATAISRLLGENIKVDPAVSEQLVPILDKIISLRAFDKQHSSIKETVRTKIQEEPEAMRYLASYLQSIRKDDMEKSEKNPLMKINGIKGYIANIPVEGKTLIIADMAEHDKLIDQSYVFLGRFEGISGNKGYFFGNVNGSAPYNQGILQNVRDTANGVNAWGHSVGAVSGGVTMSPVVLKRYQDNPDKYSRAYVRPIYNEDGSLIALEQLAYPSMEQRLERKNDLSKSLGIMRGRQIEELYAETFNDDLINALKDMYKKDKNDLSKRKAYIDILDPNEQRKDPILKDAVSLFTQDVLNKMGDEFFVHRDMIEDAFGYRGATVGDFWTGNTRWSQKTQDQVKNIAMGLMGNDAYRMLTKGEGVLQNAVMDAKYLIVVKSVVVPAVNMLSNILQLVARNVPMTQISKGLITKTHETDYYFNQRIRQVEVESDMVAYANQPDKLNKLKTEWNAIEDSFKRLSIWPLIQAGEFTSISDATVGREDTKLTSGKWASYIEGLVDKLPYGVREAGRQALITKDTALFKGLQRAVDYSDFITKAVLYEHYTQKKGLTSEQALSRITDEYVNYDKAMGRGRQYLEKSGLFWFGNFKIRAVKTAMSMIRNNPVGTLFATVLPAPTVFGNAGLPTEDSLISILPDGSITRAVGFGQGLNAFTLNPWYAVSN